VSVVSLGGLATNTGCVGHEAMTTPYYYRDSQDNAKTVAWRTQDETAAMLRWYQPLRWSGLTSDIMSEVRVETSDTMSEVARG